MARAARSKAEPGVDQEEAVHRLDAGEEIIGERDLGDGTRSVVTSEGRKLILGSEGQVIARTVGPRYDWE